MDKSQLYLYSWELDTSLTKINEGEIEVLTYANKSKFYFPYLLKSSNEFNYPLKIVGWNEEWKGFGNKLISCYNYFKSLSEDYLNRYALILDGWDVILTRDYNELILESREFNYDIIFSSSVISEKNMESKIHRYILNTGNSIFFGANKLNDLLNAGVILIKINVFIELYEKYNPNEYTDDQMLYIKILDEINYKYIIDHNNYFFLTQNPCFNIDLQLKRIMQNDIKPFVIHAPGSSNLDTILKYYFHDITDEQINTMRPDQLLEYDNKTFSSVKKFVLNNFIKTFVLLFAVILNIKKIITYIIPK